MSIKERLALIRAGIVIGKITYNDTTNVILLPHFLLRFKLSSFPDMKTFDEIFHNTAVNSTILTFCGKSVGLKFMKLSWENKVEHSLGVCSSHPASKYWLSILQPIWDEQNKDKCKVCHGSGWDGDGYTLSCYGCGGSGKNNNMKKAFEKI